MAVYSLGDVVDAIEATLSAAAILQTHLTYDELGEGIAPADLPQLQVYPEENTGTSGHSETDRLSFSGEHSIKTYIIHADLYAKSRPSASIGEDMGRLIVGIDQLEDILDTQTYPLFGVDCITSFQWSWRRVVFEYAGVSYVGARFLILFEAGTGEK